MNWSRISIIAISLTGLALMSAAILPATSRRSSPLDSPKESGMLLVANKGEHTLGIVDPAAAKQVSVVPESGVTGHELIASPDSKTAYVPIYGDSGVGKPGTNGSTLDVFDIATHKLTNTIDFGHGVRPHCALFGPKDGLLYVTTELDKSITIIDPKTLKIVGAVPTGQDESHMLAITHDGRRGYTANVGPGTVSVLDMVARKTITIIPISKTTQRISISMDDKWVFTADQTKPQMAVISTASNKVANWIELPDVAYGTAPTPDGKYLVAAMIKSSKVAVIDLKTLKVAQTIDVPKAPQEVVISPDGKTAYVSCDASGKIAAISTSDWKVSLIDAGKGADGLAWAR